MKSTRFNPPIDWKPTVMNDQKTRINRYFFGLIDLMGAVANHFSSPFRENTKMIEIGTYGGESTLLFASSLAFDHIYCIDPFEGKEAMNNINNKKWDDVKADFNQNTKWFNGDGSKLGETKVELINDYSYNVVDQFEDKSIDFIYIDGSHDLKDIKRDIDLYLPKVKDSSFIGGHDYNWPGVEGLIKSYGKEVFHFGDESWVIKVI
jgi:hypothetical protein|tara:strand:+ start:2056 stop:2673 length:618 start_codon:yes stop_codon:yes gene_type:complete